MQSFSSCQVVSENVDINDKRRRTFDEFDTTDNVI